VKQVQVDAATNISQYRTIRILKALDISKNKAMVFLDHRSHKEDAASTSGTQLREAQIQEVKEAQIQVLKYKQVIERPEEEQAPTPITKNEEYYNS
ncbi:11615_t:CDS:2, partial [Gigaspora margarita]